MGIRDNLITAEEAEGLRNLDIITNEERGKLEQFEIWRDKPSRLFAYIKPTHEGSRDVVITVWTGLPIGYGAWGPIWRSNMGDKRRSVHVTIAGEKYSGTAFVSAGDYCRLRKVKS